MYVVQRHDMFQAHPATSHTEIHALSPPTRFRSLYEYSPIPVALLGRQYARLGPRDALPGLVTALLGHRYNKLGHWHVLAGYRYALPGRRLALLWHIHVCPLNLPRAILGSGWCTILGQHVLGQSIARVTAAHGRHSPKSRHRINIYN